LPDTIRFPLSVLFVGFGLLIALVPFGGRPFTKWIMAFVKAILSPTQRIWIKEKKIPEFLWVITNPSPAPVQEVQNIDEKSKEKLEAYLATLPKSQTASPLDVSEQVALSNLHLDWHGKTAEGKMPAAIVWPSEKDISKEMGVLADSLPQISPYSDIETPKKGRPSYQKKPALLPRISYHAKPYVLGGIEARLRGKAPAIPIMPSGNANIQPKSHLASETNFATENIIPIVTPDMHIKLLHGIGKVRVRKLHFAPPSGFDLSKLPIRGEKQFDISKELKNFTSSQLKTRGTHPADGSSKLITSLDFALYGGEDYELLFTIKHENVRKLKSLWKNMKTPITMIGEITKRGINLVNNDGKAIPLTKEGYNHFKG